MPARVAAGSILLVAVAAAAAQSYPRRPLRFIACRGKIIRAAGIQPQ